jgi:hypothetical protein
MTYILMAAVVVALMVLGRIAWGLDQKWGWPPVLILLIMIAVHPVRAEEALTTVVPGTDTVRMRCTEPDKDIYTCEHWEIEDSPPQKKRKLKEKLDGWCTRDPSLAMCYEVEEDEIRK